MSPLRSSDIWFFLVRLFRVTRVDFPDASFEMFTDSATGLKLSHRDALPIEPNSQRLLKLRFSLP
jgi:hypothetical protein